MAMSPLKFFQSIPASLTMVVATVRPMEMGTVKSAKLFTPLPTIVLAVGLVTPLPSSGSPAVTSACA